MAYDRSHHHRRSIRLKGYDYTLAGAYFVTICTHQRACLFGDVVHTEMVLSEWGLVARQCWEAIPTHFPHVELDEWVVMPNHAHGIIWIVHDDPDPRSCRGEASARAISPCRTGMTRQPYRPGEQAEADASPLQHNTPSPEQAGANASRLQGPSPGSLGAIVGNLKSVTTRRINRMRHVRGTGLWQRGYYEHIIRHERALERIREYILTNPQRWEQDRENPQRRGEDDFDRWLDRYARRADP